jgi:type II secretory pathway component PulJ
MSRNKPESRGAASLTGRVNLRRLHLAIAGIKTADWDWDALAKWIVFPLTAKPIDDLASHLFHNDPSEVAYLAVARLREEALTYVREHVQAEAERFLTDVLSVLEGKLRREAVGHALRAVKCDSSDRDATRRQLARESRDFIASLTRKWDAGKPGRFRRRSDAEAAETKARLQEEIRSRRAEALRNGLPHAQADVLPDIARDWNVSVGSLDHILYPRESTSSKRKPIGGK